MSSIPNEDVLKARAAILPKGDDAPMADVPVTTYSDAQKEERLLLSECIDRSIELFAELEHHFKLPDAESAAEGYHSFMQSKRAFLAVFTKKQGEKYSVPLVKILGIEANLKDTRKEEAHQQSQSYVKDWVLGRDVYLDLRACKLPTHLKGGAMG